MKTRLMKVGHGSFMGIALCVKRGTIETQSKE